MGSSNRRVVAAFVETAQGTFVTPVASSDAIPMIRSAKVTPTSVRVDRPTIRLSLSDIADIAPGKATVEVQFEFELTANSAYASGVVNSGMRPIVTRILQGAGLSFASEAALLYPYALTSIAGTAPMRHGEAISSGVLNGRVFGDTYGDDGMIFIDQGTDTNWPTPFTTTSAGSNTTCIVGSRNTTECFGWEPTSVQPDGSGNGHRTISLAVWMDGKLAQVKGCMGNVEFVFTHGDAVVVRATMRGVLVDYADQAVPTNANEAHKYPPTFLGSRLTLREGVNAPTVGNMYGTGGGTSGALVGALNRMSLNTGNDIVLRENSMDPNGINYATIRSREPGGSFNPDEVLNSQFNLMSRFLSGTPLRLRATVSGPGTSTPVYNDPSTNNQNSYSFIASGVVFDGMQDADRDGTHAFDATFKLSGGDYDTTALGETPGNDNEFAIVHY
jgi:hypothetical protein